MADNHKPDDDVDPAAFPSAHRITGLTHSTHDGRISCPLAPLSIVLVVHAWVAVRIIAGMNAYLLIEEEARLVPVGCLTLRDTQ
mgnify:CR=1 FL=1